MLKSPDAKDTSAWPNQIRSKRRANEFFISDAADAVLVKVRESGFAHLDAPDEIRQAGVKANIEGWGHELGELKLHSEEASAA